MRIIYHHRTRAEDAQGVHAGAMVCAFRKLGHEVDVVAPVDSAERPRAQVRRVRRRPPSGVALLLYEALAWTYNLYGYLALRRAIRVAPPAVIYERYARNNLCGVWASKRFGIPLILEVNAPFARLDLPHGCAGLRCLARFSERWICTHSTRTIAVSEAVKAILVEEGVPAEHVVVMANGVDAERFHPRVSGDEVREFYGLRGKLVIGFVGWFREWHGLEMLLRVARAMIEGRDDLRFLLVGDGPAYPELARYVRENGLAERVVLAGPVEHEDVPAYIAAIDIAVQPAANSFASPMKIFEYMGMGRCIVGPDQPNIREILRDGVTARLFRPGDESHLGAVLGEVVESAEERQAIGRRAREAVSKQGYLWTENARRVLALVTGNFQGFDG